MLLRQVNDRFIRGEIAAGQRIIAFDNERKRWKNRVREAKRTGQGISEREPREWEELMLR